MINKITKLNQKIFIQQAQDKQDEIFRKMSADEKVCLTLKLSGEIFRPVRDKIKSQYPNLHPVSLSKKIYNHVDSNRDYYDSLFNQRLEEELTAWNQF